MFKHLYEYFIKVLIREKSLVFWIMLYPILLGTFFHLALKNIDKQMVFSKINIGLVAQEDSFYKPILNDKEMKKYFKVQSLTEEEASKALKNKKIDAYFAESNKKLYFNSIGFKETLIKSIFNEIDGNMKLYQKNPALLAVKATTIIKDQGPKMKVSRVNIPFYNLISMIAIYGGLLSMYLVNLTLPELNEVGKRMAISKVSKFTLVMAIFLASLSFLIISQIILFIFLYFVNIRFTGYLLKAILLALFGSIAGISLGIFVASSLKIKEKSKTGILLGVSLFGCFLSGMMALNIKYLIDTKFPLINKINPVAMITDGLYTLYYYQDNTRYLFNLISIVVFTIIMLILSVRVLRRKSYDNF